MNKSFKPQGYSSVSPYIVVNGAQQVIELLKDIFDAKELRRYDMSDGSIMHAEVKIDDSVIMIGDSSEHFPPNQDLIHIYVPDVDHTYKKAIDAGCEALEQPKERDGDPDRRGSFKDFAGNIWTVATQKESL
ncbi:MAG: VOC family protein [Balneolales bacterium]